MKAIFLLESRKTPQVTFVVTFRRGEVVNSNCAFTYIANATVIPNAEIM